MEGLFMEKQEDLEKWRTLNEMREFYHKTYSTIKNNEILKHEARLKSKKHFYKEFLEEYIPLLNYAELEYKSKNFKCRHVGIKTQKDSDQYDGEFLSSDGTLEKVEIAAPRDGHKENKDAVQLNNKGFSEGECYDIETKWNEIKQNILITSNIKAVKNYENISLVISFEYSLYINPASSIGIKMIEELLEELKDLSYIAKKVYLLVPPQESSICIFGGLLYKVK